MINKQLINLSSPASSGGNAGEEGLILHLDANDVDSYDGDGTEWVDITNHEYTPATNVSEHFNTVLYTGNETSQSITGTGFQPDLIWVKNRDTTNNHLIFDSIRGNNYIIPNDTFIESTSPSNTMSSFDSDGFSISGGGGSLNNNSDDYVAWCFKAGGAPSGSDKVSIDGTSYTTIGTAELTDGTIPVDKLSVNTNLGFSIVSYNGNQVSNATVAHGLGVKPELIIVKNLQSAVSWGVWTNGLSDSEVLRLEQTAAATSPATAYFEPQNNTSNFFSLGTNDETNHNDDYIAYCFASKRGVSKVGSYTGKTGSVNVYTGFEPAFLLIKKTNTSTNGDWSVFDNARVNGTVKGHLYASGAYPENDRDGLISFNRDGFTLENNTVGQVNTNNDSYIYYAVAKNTNETSLIPDTDLELHLDAADLTSEANTTWTDRAASLALTKSGTVGYDDELGDFIDFGGGYYGNDNTQNTPIKDSNGDFSIEFWYNFDALSGSNAPIGIMQSSSLRGLFIYFDGSTMDVYNYKAGTHSGSQFTSQTFSTLGISVGEWYHITHVIDASTDIKTYVNGELKATSTGNAGGTHWTSMDGIRIGDMQTLSYSNDGKMGQARIYSSALTQDQIRQNYNFTKPSYPNGNDGTINGATFNPGGYFDFDGTNDYIDLTALGLGGNKSRSVSVWVKVDSLATGRPVFCYGNESSSQGFNFEITSNGAIFVGYYSRDWTTTTAPITTNTWHHIVITYNGGLTQDASNTGIYVNNVPLDKTSTGSYSGVANTGNNSYEIGKRKAFRYFDGQIDSVKVYDKALTQAEITALYNKGQ